MPILLSAQQTWALTYIKFVSGTVAGSGWPLLGSTQSLSNDFPPCMFLMTSLMLVELLRSLALRSLRPVLPCIESTPLP